MKIALISPFLPYENVPHAGGQYTYRLLKFLSIQHEVSLIVRVDRDTENLTEISNICQKVYVSYSSCDGIYRWVRFLKTIRSYFSFYRLIRNTLDRKPFDLIQFEYSESAFFLKKSETNKKILNMHDVILRRILRERRVAKNVAQKISGVLPYLIYRYLENAAVQKMTHILVRSEREKDFVENHYGKKNITVLPLMVNRKYEGHRIEPEIPTLLFTGALNRKYNEIAAVYLVTKIFVNLQKEISGLKLILAGNLPGKKLKKLASEIKGIELTGYVRQLDEFYLKSTIFISPIFTGGGMIYKNLEAMGFGLPVITTDTANESIGGVNGKHLLMANNENEFKSAVKRLLTHDALRRNIGRKGQEYVNCHFHSVKVLKDYNSVINSFTSGDTDTTCHD